MHSSLIAVLLLALPLPGSPEMVCPKSGKPARADIFAFEKVHTCCAGCLDKLAKKLEVSLDPGKCPLSGKPARADILVIEKGKPVRFCCPGCRGKYAKDRSLNPEPSLGKEINACPISGKPGQADHFLVKKVHFCCAGCQGSYAKEKGLTIDFGGAPAPEAAPAAAPRTQEAGWRPLFNGKDLEAFREPTRDGKWAVEQGVLIGRGGKGVIATRDVFDHFDLEFDVRIRDTGEKRGNSGIFIRNTDLLGLRGRWPDGPEIQVDNGDPTYWTGAIWKTAPARPVETKDGEWIRMRIQAASHLIRVWVNGKLVTEYLQPGPVHRGPIAFQVHHETDVVEFRSPRIRPLVEF